MPYCPKCDMEFVEGIIVCSDCGGPLVSSKEEARRMAEAARAKEMERLAMEDPFADEDFNCEEMEPEEEVSDEQAKREGDGNGRKERIIPDSRASVRTRPKTYVKKSQKYEDMKSSVSAFLLVGVILGGFAFLCFSGILIMPMAGGSKLLIETVIAVMAVGCFLVAFSTNRSAKVVYSQIEEEERATKEIVDWFVSSYRKEDLDLQLEADFPYLSEEELSLKRFELIQDLLITNRDLPDQAYVDALCEEIYGKVFEKS